MSSPIACEYLGTNTHTYFPKHCSHVSISVTFCVFHAAGFFIVTSSFPQNSGSNSPMSTNSHHVILLPPCGVLWVSISNISCRGGASCRVAETIAPIVSNTVSKLPRSFAIPSRHVWSPTRANIRGIIPKLWTEYVNDQPFVYSATLLSQPGFSLVGLYPVYSLPCGSGFISHDLPRGGYNQRPRGQPNEDSSVAPYYPSIAHPAYLIYPTDTSPAVSCLFPIVPAGLHALEGKRYYHGSGPYENPILPSPDFAMHSCVRGCPRLPIISAPKGSREMPVYIFQPFSFPFIHCL